MNEKKVTEPKEEWTFDARVDSMLAFAIQNVLALAESDEYGFVDSLNFIKVAFENLCDCALYVQARPKDYDQKKFLKVFETMLQIYQHRTQVIMDTRFPSVMPFIADENLPEAKIIPNPYNKCKIEYEKIINLFQCIPSTESFVRKAKTYVKRGKKYGGIAILHTAENHFRVVNDPGTNQIVIEVPRMMSALWTMKNIKSNGSTSTRESSRTSDNDTQILTRSLLQEAPIYNLMQTPTDDLESVFGYFQRLITCARCACFYGPVNLIEFGITLYRFDEKVIELINRASRIPGIRCRVFLEMKATGEVGNDLEALNRMLIDGDRRRIDLRLNYSNTKVHGKMIYMKYRCMVNDQWMDKILSVVSTGNYRVETSKTYRDYHYVTTDESVGNMVVRNMNTLFDDSQPYISSILPLILKEIYVECAKGKNGRIWIQTNHLDSKPIVKALKEAVECGVDVRLIVRTTKGFKKKDFPCKTITGEYLEHARVYIFGNYHSKRIPRAYISSSDLIFKNPYNRYETYVRMVDQSSINRLIAQFDDDWTFGQSRNGNSAVVEEKDTPLKTLEK